MPTMKAWRASSYGTEGDPADTIANLKLEDVEIPSAGAGEILVRVELAAVNPIDWKLFSGGMHGMFPCTFPYVPGFDITGEVTAVGEGAHLRRHARPVVPATATRPPTRQKDAAGAFVIHDTRCRLARGPTRHSVFFPFTSPRRYACAHAVTPNVLTRRPPGVSDFQVSDKVCAYLGLCETCVNPKPARGHAGAFAAFAVVPASLCARASGVDPAAAAGLPLAGLTAYQALFTKAGRTPTGDVLGDLRAGQKLLVLGGATAVGAFAIQLAKNAGAFVACTASARRNSRGVAKTKACADLGADVVVDYGKEEWSETLAGRAFDLVFDAIGSQRDWRNAAAVLKKGAAFVSVANFAADPAANESNAFKNFLVKSDGGNLAELVAMVEAGEVTVPVDSVVPFADVPAALTKSRARANAGKIVIAVAK